MPTPVTLTILILCIVATGIALVATLAMLKQKNNTRRTDELELSMEAVARDVAVAYESLVGEISEMRQETGQAVQAEQEKIASLINGLGGATNQVLRELAGAQEAQATAAEETRALVTAGQAELTALVAGLDARLGELTVGLAQPTRRVAKKADPAPQAPVVEEPPAPAAPEPAAEEPEEPQPEPTRESVREPAGKSAREPAGKRLPARKAMGKKSVRKPPR